MRTPSRSTPDIHDYAVRRPNCLIESVQKVYNSSFSTYTGPQSHYTEKSINKKDPKWLYDRAKSERKQEICDSLPRNLGKVFGSKESEAKRRKGLALCLWL